MSCRIPAVTLISLVLLTGCARIPDDAGFTDVQRTVADRLGQHIIWRRGAPEEAEVDRAVLALLAQPLTADAALRISLLNNPSLQATYEELGVAQADLVQAGLLRNPVFVASARFPDKSGQTNLEFQVVEDFLDLLLLPARRSLAEAQFEQVRLRVGNEVLDLAAEVQVAYYDLLGARQIAEMRRMVKEAAGTSAEMAARIHEAGNLSDVALASERILYEEARVAWARAETDVQAARERLTRLMGLWGERTAWTVAGRLPDVPAEELPIEHLESMAIARRLDMAAARREWETAAYALDVTREWRSVPLIEVGVSAERDTDGGWVTGPNVALGVPLFDQGQARVAGLESRLRQAERRMTALAVDIRSEVRALRDRLLATRRIIEHYGGVIIPLREQVVELTQQQYNYMLVGVFELIIARQQEFDAYQTYLEAVRDYWIARAELERAAGGRLSPAPAATGPEQPASREETPAHEHMHHQENQP